MVVARAAEEVEDKEEVMADRVGREDRREARARYMMRAGVMRAVSGTAFRGRAGVALA